MVESPRWHHEDLIGDMLAIGALRAPDRPLFAIDGGESRTYAQVHRRANRIGHALLGAGLRQGDRVAVWSDDCVEYLETYMGAARAGLVVVPINNRLTAEEARFIAHDSDARCLMVSDRLAPLADEAFSQSDFALVAAYGEERPLGATAFEDLLPGAAESEPPRPSEEDLFVIAYTSGTTGFPKGAMLTHRSVKNIARMNTVSYHLPLASVAAYTGSMSFTATVCAFGMSHLYVGGSVVLLGKWDPERAVDMVVRNRANFVYVPTPGIPDFSAALGQAARRARQPDHGLPLRLQGLAGDAEAAGRGGRATVRRGLGDDRDQRRDRDRHDRARRERGVRGPGFLPLGGTRHRGRGHRGGRREPGADRPRWHHRG